MNLPVNTKTALPAHLAHLASNTTLMSMNQSASAGISAGGWPRISIKGSRFRLQSPQGEEVVVNSLDLDVIVLDANPHGLSKTYYAGAYDPSVDEKAPDCYSDNGVGPSSKAKSPQCGTCVACPHNVWGSKINPSGSQTKACSDSKKVAVIIAGNPDGPVFELRVPPASLKNWATYIDSLDKRGIPAAALVTKLSFDPASDFPKLMFAAAGWADENQAAAVLEVIGTEEVDQCTGKNDKVHAGQPALLLPADQPAPLVPQSTAGQLPPLPDRAMPLVAQSQALPLAMVDPALNPPVAVMLGQPTPAKRTRRTKAEMVAAAPPAVPEQMPIPAFLANVPQAAAPLPPLPTPSAAATVAPLTAPVTNSALDDLIAQAMKA